MSIFMWRILCLASAVAFVIGVITLFCTRLLKNRYYHEYVEDELLKSVKAVNSKNSIYFASGETAKYIKKYVVCKTVYDKYIVCNFARCFDEIKYFVVQYSRSKKVISVLEVTECNTGANSKVISLSKRCAYVNVVASSADGVKLNSDVIRPLSMNKVRLYAFLKSFVVFLGLFIVRHAAIELFAGVYMKQYLNHFIDYVIIGGSFLFAVILYFVTVLCFRRKNAKSSNGGALEYEFV